MSQPNKPAESDQDTDAIARYRRRDNPFGQHPDGIGPTLGEDLGEEPPRKAPPSAG